MWRKTWEMKLSDGLYWLLLAIVIIPPTLLFIEALGFLIYYAVTTGLVTRSFSLIFKLAFSYLYTDEASKYYMLWAAYYLLLKLWLLF
jgi:hypothetical protein